MYKLLIVDDDEIMRQGVERNIKWQENGFEIVGAVRNGVEGVEAVRVLKPDIVLSDIKMPFMDGLKMSELIYQSNPHIKIVLLTGYDDFNYAREALQLKVSNYIMKYESNEEILDAVKKAACEVERENASSRRLQKSHGLITDHLLTKLLTEALEEDYEDSGCQLVGGVFKYNRFAAAVLAMPKSEAAEQNRNIKKVHFNLKRIREISNVIAEAQGIQVFIVNSNQSIQWIFNLMEAAESLIKMELMLAEMRNQIEVQLGLQITIGVGEIHEGLEGIAISYGEALQALELRGIVPGKQIVSISEVRTKGSTHTELLKKTEVFIRKNYANADLSLQQIAEEVHMTSSYISMLFKKYKQVNISDFIVDIRMQRAIQLLMDTELKTYEISEEVGYPNSQYFSVLFKKYTGYAPTEYRLARGRCKKPS